MAEEYNIPLGVDIKNVLKNIGTVKSELSALNKEGARVGKNLTTQFQQASNASGTLTKSVIQNTKTFQQATTEANRMAGSIKNINNEVTNLNNNPLKDVEAKFTRLNGAGTRFLSTLKTIGGALGIAFGLQQIVAFGRELLDIAKKSDGVTKAFGRLEGDSTKNLQGLRDAVKGTVSDLQLMQLAIRAKNFQIPLDVLNKGLVFARQRATETGQSIDYLVNSLVDGIGRKSTLVIDNLGISASQLQEEFRKTGDFAQAVGNIIDRSMSTAGDSVDDFGTRVNRLETYWENAKLGMARFFVGLTTEIADIVSSDNWREFWDRITNWGKGNEVTQAKNLVKAFTDVKNVVKDGFISDQSIVNRVQAGEDFNFIYSEAKKNYDKIKGAHADYIKGVESGNLKERDRTIKDYGVLEKRAKDYFDTIARVGKNNGFGKNANAVKYVIDTSSVEELEKKLEDLQGKRYVSQNKAEIDSYNKQIEAVEKQLDKLQGKREKVDRSIAVAEKKAIQRAKQVADERVKIENDTLQAQVDLIDDAITKAVAKETTESQSRIRILENRKKAFPELVKQINALIESEELASEARVTAIIKKGEEERLKEVRASQAEIRKVMRSEYQNQIDDVVAKYEVIIENAKKAGTLTADIEKSLEIQKGKDIAKITLEQQQKTLDLQEQVALSTIYQIKRKQGQSEESFERQNQEKVLAVFIEYAQKRLELIKADPTKIGEVNDLTVAIQNAQKEITNIQKEQKGDLFDFLKIDPEKIKDYADAVSKVAEITSGVLDTFASGSQAKVDKIKEEIDSLDDLISAQENAVDREKDLLEKGFANNYENEKKTLESQKQTRAELLKQQEEAQKKAQALQRAQIIADSVSQASNLITASTDIFKTFAKIPFVGIPLAIAMIGTMMGAFVFSKAEAIKNTKFAEGGTIGGKSHSQGGNKYISMDGNSMMEHERGEEVTKRTSAEKHRDLLKAINKDDFSNISLDNISLKELLRDTGVSEHVEIAKKSGENNVNIVKQSRTVNNIGSDTLEEIHATLKEFMKFSKTKPEVTDYGDYIEIKKGNKTERIWKK